MEQNQQVGGINISDYQAKKTTGLLSISKIGDAYAITAKTFSATTGAEEKPQVYGISIDDLNAQKEQLLKSISDIEFLVADFKALDK